MSDLFGVKGRQFLKELSELPEVEKIVLTSNLKVLEDLEAEIAAIEKELSLRAIALPGVGLLLGIPGIDVLAALTILAEIGEVRRFTSAKKLASFSGLVPSVHQSGKTRYTGHITKAGRSMLSLDPDPGWPAGGAATRPLARLLPEAQKAQRP